MFSYGVLRIEMGMKFQNKVAQLMKDFLKNVKVHEIDRILGFKSRQEALGEHTEEVRRLLDSKGLEKIVTKVILPSEKNK